MPTNRRQLVSTAQPGRVRIKPPQVAYGSTVALKESERSFPIPFPSTTWRLRITNDWDALWRGPHGTLFLISDVGGLRRLYDMKNEADFLMDRIIKDRENDSGLMSRQDLGELLSGKKKFESQEEILWKLYSKVQYMIAAMEDRYGLSPISRARVGLAFSEARRAADEAAKAAVDAPDDDNDDYDDYGPPAEGDIPLSIREEDDDDNDDGEI